MAEPVPIAAASTAVAVAAVPAARTGPAPRPLSDDCIWEIMHFADGVSLAVCASVCRGWAAICYEPVLWDAVVARTWPYAPRIDLFQPTASTNGGGGVGGGVAGKSAASSVTSTPAEKKQKVEPATQSSSAAAASPVPTAAASGVDLKAATIARRVRSRPVQFLSDATKVSPAHAYFRYQTAVERSGRNRICIRLLNNSLVLTAADGTERAPIEPTIEDSDVDSDSKSIAGDAKSGKSPAASATTTPPASSSPPSLGAALRAATSSVPPFQYSQPTFSPAGDKLVFSRLVRFGSKYEMFIIDTVTNRTLLRYSMRYPPFYYFWSPDGSRLTLMSAWSSRHELVLRRLDVAACIQKYEQRRVAKKRSPPATAAAPPTAASGTSAAAQSAANLSPTSDSSKDDSGSETDDPNESGDIARMLRDSANRRATTAPGSYHDPSDIEVLSLGRPLFFSFNAAGTHIVTHQTVFSMNIIDITTLQSTPFLNPAAEHERSGSFASPAWLKTGNNIAFVLDRRIAAEEDGETDPSDDSLTPYVHLVVADRYRKEPLKVLAAIPRRSSSSLFASRDGTALAYIIEESGTLHVHDFSAVNLPVLAVLSIRELKAAAAQIGLANEVVASCADKHALIDLIAEARQSELLEPMKFAATRKPVHAIAVLAAFWSPNNRYLLYLRQSSGNTAAWAVWDRFTFRTSQYAEHQPSGTFANEYLPFIDQYAQSLQFWSADSSHFVYASGGQIYIQRVTFGGDAAPPVSISHGDFAAFSK